MKIALLSDCYPPRLGGIETQVRDLGRHLTEAGHEVHVFTATPARPAERGRIASSEHGVCVHRHTLGLPFDLPVNPLLPGQVRAELADCEVAHVHMGVISPVATSLAELALDLGMPTAITWHCVLGRAASSAHRRRGRIARWQRRGAALSAVSRLAATRVEHAGAEGPVAVLPNGIDVARWRAGAGGGAGAGVGTDDVGPATAEAAAPDSGRVPILSALRFAPRKRVRPLLGMLRQVEAVAPGRVAATAYGDGPLLGLARALTRGQRDWLDLPGRVPRGRLVTAYAGDGIYLAPARMEAFGIAALEARTAGLPVVALRDSGVADFITDGVHGLLAEDDAGLVAALGNLVADPVLRHRIRDHNRTTPPRQAWPAVLGQVLAEYRRAGARP